MKSQKLCSRPGSSAGVHVLFAHMSALPVPPHTLRFCNLSSSNAEGLPGAQCSFELGQPLAEAHGCSSLPPPPRQQQQQQQQQHAACWHDQRHQEQHLQQPQQQWQSGHGDQALTHQGACSTSASTCALASSPGPVPGTSCVSAPSLTPPCAAACQFSALVSLPMELLAEVLRSDELSVDSEAEVLQVRRRCRCGCYCGCCRQGARHRSGVFAVGIEDEAQMLLWVLQEGRKGAQVNAAVVVAVRVAGLAQVQQFGARISSSGEKQQHDLFPLHQTHELADRQMLTLQSL